MPVQQLPATHTTLRRHVRRATGRDRNPLCRRLDRAYSRLVTSLALVLAAAAAVSVWAALLVYRTETHTAAASARHRHAVTAVTTGPAWSDDFRAGAPRAQAEARWEYPAGPGSGAIHVQAGTPVGTSVPILLDDSGKPAAAARSTGLIASDAVLVGLGTGAMLATATAGAYEAGRRTLDRRAERSWEPDWERVEPHWSGRG
ncbi:hypothetical protein [Kitasatospora sp. NPDC056181]|uniref:Rv1733c family protein n=1 Tax=Kitasatospora sp. NPDC056181 TaxID=3345737 RepID=UPI0035D6AD56